MLFLMTLIFNDYNSHREGILTIKDDGYSLWRRYLGCWYLLRYGGEFMDAHNMDSHGMFDRISND